MRGWSRHRRGLAAMLLLACLMLTAGALGATAAGAQTTTTAPVATTAGGTTGSTTTVSGNPPTTASGTQSGTTTTSNDDSGSDIPWVPIAIAVVVVLAIILLLVLMSRRRGRRVRAADDWRGRAADATAEIGATARLLSAGNPATPAIAQQILASLRAYDDLAATAPDGAARSRTARPPHRADPRPGDRQ